MNSPARSAQQALPTTIGSFKVLKELGRGSMSTVYLVERESERYALKLMSDFGEDRNVDMRGRFRLEVAALYRMNSPGLVRFVDSGEFGQRPFLVMELADGDNLRALVSKGPVPLPLLISVAKAITEALVEIHRHGFVHRDVKPDNV